MTHEDMINKQFREYALRHVRKKIHGHGFATASEIAESVELGEEAARECLEILLEEGDVIISPDDPTYYISSKWDEEMKREPTKEELFKSIYWGIFLDFIDDYLHRHSYCSTKEVARDLFIGEGIVQEGINQLIEQKRVKKTLIPKGKYVGTSYRGRFFSTFIPLNQDVRLVYVNALMDVKRYEKLFQKDNKSAAPATQQ